ncbi:MAG TPA: insulinase family protein, partial [Gemmatimonadaceae bacterium]|nr:insulinase family protein [Gemmatimonadaceae bacterium]
GLGGRFFDVLRDQRSLCYTVQVSVMQRTLAGAFVSYIATSPDKESAARDGLLAEFKRLRDEPVSADELARAQTYAIGALQISRQTGAAILGEVIDAWLCGDLADIDAREARIRSVTVEQMQAVARRYFDPDRRVEGVVRGSSRT